MARPHPVHLITIDTSGEVFPCDESGNVLAAMVRLGRRGIPSGCRGGGCGVCKVAVLEGEYETLAMSADHVNEGDRLAGRVLACRLIPKSDLTLRVIGKMARAWTGITTSPQTQPSPVSEP